MTRTWSIVSVALAALSLGLAVPAQASMPKVVFGEDFGSAG